MAPTALVPRPTIEDIVASRNRALTRFTEARTALAGAYEALAAAHAETPGVGQYSPYNSGNAAQENALLPVVKVPAHGDFVAAARYVTDRRVWGHLVQMTDLERLMDKTAKDQLRQQLLIDPPEVTVDNVVATLERFAADAGTIFKRGIAAAFSALDRRFRSHDGWKIGARVILDHALDEWGHWSSYSNKRDSLRDIERVFFVLDDKAPPTEYAGIVGAIEESRRGGRFGQPKQSEAQSDYFTARCFKNGNLHLWFRRDDLLEKVNRLLGDYYGAPIPEEREPEEDSGLYTPKTALAKNYGFFPTPSAAAQQVMELLPLRTKAGAAPLTVLEPSAGTGNLARLCADAGAMVDCVEVHAERAAGLRAERRYRRVTQCDFLALAPGSTRYDRIVMNPPFDRERDIDHVMHALKFLKPEGCLCAVMSAGPEFRETRKSKAFREFMTEKNVSWHDLPPGSFASVGTNCNAIVVTVWMSGKKSY